MKPIIAFVATFVIGTAASTGAKMATAKPAPHGAAAIHHDPEQPGREALRISTPRQRPVGPDEAVLHRLLRVFPVPQHVQRVAPERVAVSRHEGGVRVQVSGERAGDQGGIAVAHLRETLGQDGL